MASTPIRWQPESFIGEFDGRWQLDNAYIDSSGALVIDGGGKATLELIDEVNVEFKYLRLVVTFSSGGISFENNYRNRPTIFIKEVYKDSDNEIESVKIRSVGFNTIKEIENQVYRDETIFATLDKRMAKFKIEIRNETTSPLTIHSLQVFQSVDLSETQVSRLVNNVMKLGAAETIKVYRNEDNTVNGLGVFIQGSLEELKFKPTYFNGSLLAIETNFGQTISVQNVKEMISLTTSSTQE